MRLPTLLLLLLLTSETHAQKDIPSQIDQLIRPYATSDNFYGTVYVARAGKVLFHKSFGYASLENKVLTSNNTAYHLASVSKPFTSSAILLLEQQGKLNTSD